VPCYLFDIDISVKLDYLAVAIDGDFFDGDKMLLVLMLLMMIYRAI